MRRRKAILLALASVLTISGVVVALWATMRGPTGGVTLGQAAPGEIPVGFHDIPKGTILAANQWPDACSFVHDAEIKAIFPGAHEIQHETRTIHTFSIKEFAADPSWKEGDRSPTGQCLYSMRLPGESYSSTQFWLRIEAVADPELISAYYKSVRPAVNTNQGSSGADACALTGLAEGSWFCHKGPLLFTVGGQTTVRFKGKFAPATFVWRDDVLPQFLRTITAKIK